MQQGKQMEPWADLFEVARELDVSSKVIFAGCYKLAIGHEKTSGGKHMVNRAQAQEWVEKQQAEDQACLPLDGGKATHRQGDRLTRGERICSKRLRSEVKTWLTAHPGVPKSALSLFAGLNDSYVAELVRLRRPSVQKPYATALRKAMRTWDAEHKKTPGRGVQVVASVRAKRPWWAFWRR